MNKHAADILTVLAWLLVWQALLIAALVKLL